MAQALGSEMSKAQKREDDGGNRVDHGQHDSTLSVRRLASEAAPSWLVAGAMLGLIFGGCCSNVRAHSSGMAVLG